MKGFARRLVCCDTEAQGISNGLLQLALKAIIGNYKSCSFTTRCFSFWDGDGYDKYQNGNKPSTLKGAGGRHLTSK